MPHDRKTKIFLSYARKDDEAFVRRLYEDLTKAGFDVWFDRVSMPSRSLTFHQEIRDAIHAQDRLVLVIGPGAVTSDYVMQEWQFAYFADDKCVNPIVRLDGRDAQENRVDGYALIPEDLKLLHAEDFRDDSRYVEHLKNLVRQLSEGLSPVGKLVAVPELPPGYRAHPERLRALRDLLLLDLRTPTVVTGAAARLGLHGMGGIGKSVLANALARHPEVRRAFKDNIFWIHLGQTPDVEELQRRLAKELGGDDSFRDWQTGKEELRRLLADRATLMILDDVWEREHAEAFNVASPLGRILLTTRDAGLVTALSSRENHYRVELPTLGEAEAILGSAAEVSPENLPPETRAIVQQCGRLPLALALCGGMAHEGIGWVHILEALRSHDLQYLSIEHPLEEHHRSAWIAMDVSVRSLSEEARVRFAELAVFGQGTDVPEAAIATLWAHTAGMTPRQAAKLLADLARRSLVQSVRTGGDPTESRFSLHDLLLLFVEGMAVKQFGSAEELHRRLLEAYRAQCPGGWPTGPDDGYFLQSLCRHLVVAGKTEDAIDLLCDLLWIEAKCRAGLVFDLVKDYRETMAALPEMRKELYEEGKRVAQLTRWTEDLIRYSREWTQRRERLERKEKIDSLEPGLPELPDSCRMWTEVEIADECGRIVEHPTRLDRIKAFVEFVDAECYPLLQFARREGFVLQHAFNSAPSGAVHDAATGLLKGSKVPVLLRRWRQGEKRNPKPALLRTFEGHSDHVESVIVIPDGRRAVSGSRDGTVRVWDLESGACLWVLKGHSDRVSCVSITPDGRCAISGSWDKTVRLWNLESGTCNRVLEGHSSLIESVSITPDGRRAVSGSWDDTIRVWDLESGACLQTLKGHAGVVESVSVTPDGRRAVSGGWDKTVRMWDLVSGTCLRTYEGHGYYVTSVSVTPDGRRAASGSRDGTVRVWDVESGTCLRVLEGHSRGVSSASITLDGRYVASGSYDQTVRMWDVESGTCLRTLEGHSYYVESVSVIPDGRQVASGGRDDAVRVWNVESGTCLRTLEGHSGGVSSVSITPDGHYAVSGGFDKKVGVWDTEIGTCLRTLEGHTGRVSSVSLTRDGRRAVSGSWDNTARVWDLESGNSLVLEGHVGRVSSVSVTRDGRRAVSGSWDNTARVWELENGTCLRTFRGHADVIGGVSVDQYGLRAVSGSWDKTIRIWDVESGTCLRVLEGHGDLVTSVGVTQDGRLVASGSHDKTIRIWDVESGACLRTLEGHKGCVWSVAVTPDGRYVLSASDDKTVRLWDLVNGASLGLCSVGSVIWSVASAGQGSILLIGTQRGEVNLFEFRDFVSVNPNLKVDPAS